jgi:Flp pilus assembly protein TadG
MLSFAQILNATTGLHRENTIVFRNLGRQKSPQSNVKSGAACVELAVCLPILILLSVNVIELCSMIFIKQSLAIAAYETAHQALQRKATAASSIAVGMNILSQRHVKNANITISPSDINNVPEGEYFTVMVSTNASDNRLFAVGTYGALKLEASVTAMKELAPIQ